MRTGRTIALTAALVLAVAGCGDDGDDGDPTATEPATAEPDDGPGDASGLTVTVSGLAFQDASVTVPAGATVTWTNEDSVAHTVTSGTPDEATAVFDEPLPGGGQATVTVDEPGTYAYFCEIHPSMTAEVVVEG